MAVNNVLLPGGKPVGTPGSNATVRVVPGELQEAEEFFDELTQGGKDITPPSYVGRMVELPGGGGIVGIRPASKSGPPTIDVNVPSVPFRKIKFVSVP